MAFNFDDDQLIIKPYQNEGTVYVRQQKGRFQRLRRQIATALLAIFVLLPWLRMDGQQAILLDVEAQQFQFFGATLFPQDFMILVAVLMIGAFALFFLSTWLGRVWCGFLCPQTVWMFIYVWVEEKIEGARNRRIKNDKAPLNAEKALRKTAKHTVWLALAFFTSLSFMAYFIPVDKLYGQLVQGQWSGLVLSWVGLFTFCTYVNAGWMREKMCIYMCPYSRFQSAMFDADTRVVAYDADRGENRGPRKRKQDPVAMNLGDCVDCNLCVEVCPTGIDIRNGLQYECISCGACIDACDHTMERFDYKKGLISFTSENALAGRASPLLRGKVFGYGFVTLVSVVLLAVVMIERTPLEVSVIRDRNALYRVNPDGAVENSYQLKITNKSQQPQSYRLTLAHQSPFSLDKQDVIIVPAKKMLVLPFTLTTNQGWPQQGMSKVQLEISADDDPSLHIQTETRFYTPSS